MLPNEKAYQNIFIKHTFRGSGNPDFVKFTLSSKLLALIERVCVSRRHYIILEKFFSWLLTQKFFMRFNPLNATVALI